MAGRPPRVVITGASGFIGRALVRACLLESLEVHAVSRRRPPDLPQVTWHEVDLLDPAGRADWIGAIGAETLVLGAWCAEPPGYRTSPDNAGWAESTVRLARAFADAGGRRVVGIGTSAEYDQDAGLCDELRTASAPANAYGEAKLAAGRQVLCLCADAGVPAAWLRLFSQYGPFEHPTRVVAHTIRSLLAGRPVASTDGRQRRDFLHVSDVGRAVCAVASSGATGVINIGSGQAVPLRDVLLRIGEVTGRGDLIHFGEVERHPDERDLFAPVTARLTGEVGWTPRIALDDGLVAAVAWWHERALSVG
jgi:nucleoside-diphosphate-sugar epimerase